jgi:acyl-CoA synthetase (AMP-forming)/AMP-acid ligase II
MITAFDLVAMAAGRAPDRLALVDDLTPRRLTFKALVAEIEAVAAGFARRGVRPGQRVATVLNNCFEHGIAVLALTRLGAVPCLLNFRLPPADLAKLMARGEMAGAVIHADAAVAASLKAALPAGTPLLSVGGPAPGAEDFAHCRADAASLPPPLKPAPEEPAFVFYTSGTTGLPKGAVIPHRATAHRALWLATQAGLRHGGHNRTLAFMPISHCIGFYGIYLVTLAFDGTVYCQTQFNPADAVARVRDNAITYLFAVPTLYHAMTKAPGYAPEAMRSLELVLWGGGAIAPDLFEHVAARWGGTKRHIYGTTETMCSGYNPAPTAATLTTFGPGVYTVSRIVRLGGGPDDVVAPGEEGELIVDATVDTIFTGYLNRPDATAEKLRGAWYHTGDVVRAEADGRWTLMGRVDDMIRTGGENVHPEDVEAVVATHPGVGECSAIALPDPRWGQIVACCVVRRDGALAPASLDAHCRAAGLAPFKRPKAYFFVDTLPRNAANKVLRRLLRDAAGQARAAGAPAYTAL